MATLREDVEQLIQLHINKVVLLPTECLWLLDRLEAARPFVEAYAMWAGDTEELRDSARAWLASIKETP